MGVAWPGEPWRWDIQVSRLNASRPPIQGEPLMRVSDLPDGYFKKRMELTLKSGDAWEWTGLTLFRSAELLFDASEKARQKKWEAFIAGTESDEGDWFEMREMSEEDIALEHRAFAHPVALMLAGFALENLLKGIILIKEPGSVDDDGILRRGVATHELRNLFRGAEVPFDESEEDLLEYVEAHIKWLGRYPAPLSWKKLREHETRRDRGREIVHVLGKDRQVLVGLFERVVDALNDLAPQEKDT